MSDTAPTTGEPVRKPAVSGRKPRRWAVGLLRGLWQLAVVCVVLVATYVTAGRLLMPMIATQATGLELQLSRLLGATVGIESIAGSWFHFSPSIEAHNVTVVYGEGENRVEHRVERLFLGLDVPASLRQRDMIISCLTVAGLELALREDESGRWTLEGLVSGGSIDYARQLLDFLLNTREIVATESRLLLRRADGSELDLGSVFLDLDNSSDRHELLAQFRIGGQASPTVLSAVLQGTIGAIESMNAYLQAPPFDLLPLLSGVDTGSWQMQSLEGGGRFWLTFGPDGLQHFQGDVDGLNASGANGERHLLLENGSMAFALWPDRKERGEGDSGLHVRMNTLDFDWDRQPWEIPALDLYWPFTEGTFELRAPSLDMEMLSRLTASLAPLPEEARRALDTLAPRGMLRNLQLESAADGSYPGGFLLRANLEDGAVEAWSGAPAGSGLQAFVQVTADGGFAEVDSNRLRLHLPRLFATPWDYDQVNARVEWVLEEDGFRVRSGPIAVVNAGIDGRVQFDLHQRSDSRGDREAELTLLVGVSRLEVSQRALYLPTLESLRDTMGWLQGSLEQGVVRDSGFMLRTPTISTTRPASTTFSTWYEVEGGQLRYLDEWPPLEDIAASVRVRDGDVDVITTRAAIAGIALDPASASVRPAVEGGSLLVVEGTAVADTGAGLAFLRETPVREAIGPFLDEWQASGLVTADIVLTLPLGGDANRNEIAVAVHSEGSSLTLPEQALTLEDIVGDIHYHSATGLRAEALTGTLFGFPMQARIATEGDEGARRTVIAAQGSASPEALAEWDLQPAFVRGLLGFMEGSIDYDATLTLFGEQADTLPRSRLELRSDLQGLDSHLPSPLGREASQRGSIAFTLDFHRDGQLLNALYGDQLSAALVLDENGIDRGQVYLGSRNRDFTIRQLDESMPGLLVNGDLPVFDLAAWQEVAAHLQQDTGEGRGPRHYLRLVDVNIGELIVGGQALEDINMQLSWEDDAWLAVARNSMLSGRLRLPGDPDLVWTVDLDYLRFPPSPEPASAEGEEDEPVDLLADLDPRTLPALDFSAAEISRGDDNLGSFAFTLRPTADGAAIRDFRMDAAEAQIRNLEGEGGASVDWRYDSGRHESRFNGLLLAGNLARLLPAWGRDANVESRSARFSGTLEWPGSPLAFRLRESSGQMLMDIRNGRFVDIESNSSRLVGALNFDELVRRMQLDFSDLFQRGFAYDRISADLNFDDGVVRPTGGLLIEGPSSRITINGIIDLAQETIAADMRVRIPLGQNISMLAGLLGAWPVAVSAYLASKIFQDQVDDFATVVYRLEGPWSSPQAGFEPPADADSP